jgi:hypothetical protein
MLCPQLCTGVSPRRYTEIGLFNLCHYTKATAADGATYGCDVVFMCTGMNPSTAFLKAGAHTRSLHSST